MPRLTRFTRPRPLARKLPLATLIFALGGFTSVHAQITQSSATAAVQIEYQLPAGSLGALLSQAAAQGGIALSFDAALTQGLKSPGLSGTFTPLNALEQLLQGSSLQLVKQTDGSYQLQPKQTTGKLQKVKVEADLGSTTEHSGSYTSGSASTASRLPLTLRETPQSVSVITRQQIEDRNFVTLDDAMKTATGITSSTANFNRVSYTARGFSLTDNMIDGIPSVGNAYAGYVPNLAFFDRVEVLRGAAGLVYGAGSAGGTVNLIRKRPTAEPQVSTVVRVGSWNNFYSELDASGSINENKTVRGRLVVLYEDRENFIDEEYTRRPAIYGIGEWDLGDSTLVHLGASLERYDGNYAPYGLPRYTDGSDLKLPRSSRGMSPGWGTYYTDVDTVFAGVDHQFNERWSLRVTSSFQERVQGGLTTNTTGAVNPTTLTGPAYGTTMSNAYSPGTYQASDAMLSGSFDAFGQTHDVVAGVTWSETESKAGRSATGPASPVIGNIFTFDPWAVPQPAFGAWVKGNTETVNEQSGGYLIGRFTLAEPLKLIVGARLSNLDNTTTTLSTGNTIKTSENNEVTPYGGVVFDVAENWSAYASYTDIFRAQNTLYTADKTPLEPAIGANYEAGVKGELYDGRLNTSFAVFRIDEDNRAQIDPDNAAPCAGSPTGLADCYIATGKVRGEGFEVEVSGEILPGWEMVAGYTYVSTEYLHDRTKTGAPSANEGKAFRSATPEHLLQLWSNYRFSGALDGWSLGGGVSAQSDIYITSGTLQVNQGGYSLWNARVGYTLNNNWNLGLNVNNLFDKVYYSQLGYASGNRYGEPRNVTVSLRGTF